MSTLKSTNTTLSLEGLKITLNKNDYQAHKCNVENNGYNHSKMSLSSLTKNRLSIKFVNHSDLQSHFVWGKTKIDYEKPTAMKEMWTNYGLWLYVITYVIDCEPAHWLQDFPEFNSIVISNLVPFKTFSNQTAIFLFKCVHE